MGLVAKNSQQEVSQENSPGLVLTMVICNYGGIDTMLQETPENDISCSF